MQTMQALFDLVFFVIGAAVAWSAFHDLSRLLD